MSRLRNCSSCNELFIQKFDKMICDNCLAKKSKEFLDVKVFLHSNPNSSIDEIASQVNLSKNRVINIIKSGKIPSDILPREMHLKCIWCGSMINMGKLCNACAELTTLKLNKEL